MYKFFIFEQTYFRGENMKKRLKKPVIYALYALSFVTIIGTIYMLEMISSPAKLDDDSTYVDDVIIEDEVPVINTKNIITRPYLVDVTIARYFYDYQATEEEQQKSLIYYENTYIPNSGVDYKSEEIFNVVSVLDGKVTKVEENNLLGKIIEVTHDNNLISVYQSLSETLVVEGDNVLQGQIIGKSGESNISKDLGNHLHFELIHNSKNVNPELYYDKQVGEL